MFAQRMNSLRPSPIRDILAVLDRPDMISFAGGLPASEMLPRWSGPVAPSALQYGPSEGDPDLRATVSDRLIGLGIDAPPERVMILSGSQQGIDLVAKLFIDGGTPVATQFPTYLAALQVFRMYGAQFTPIGSTAAAHAPLTYIVPTFANPTGACATADERTSIAELCRSTGSVLFEDDPYRELVYDDCDRTPIAAQLTGGSWVYQGSFSKTFAPGLRLGFLAASADVFGHLVMAKQAVDLHSSRLSQRIVHEAITDASWDDRLVTLVDFYRDRRDRFDATLTEELGGLAQWQRPRGGLFYWLQLHQPVDTRTLLADAIDHNVAFMPGEEFYPTEPTLGTMRLNFSHATPERASLGLRRLADLISG